MAAIVLAGQSRPSGFMPTPLWQGIESWWEAPNGDTWNLTNGSSGVLLRPGTRGFGNPEFESHQEELPGLGGATFLGTRAKSREVFWVLGIYEPKGSQEFLSLDADFWDTMDPDAFGWWYVRTPNGSTRRLRIRFRDEGSTPWELKPGTSEWMSYGIYLEATEQPLWEGTTITVGFPPPKVTSFFGATGGPPFTIGVSSSTETARITNPGQADAWPVWRLDGPFTSATVGTVGRTTAIPVNIPAGRTLIIDTDPRTATAYLGTWNNSTQSLADGATNVMRQIGVTNFAPIPKGRNVPLTLNAVGTGLISATITPLYRRAW